MSHSQGQLTNQSLNKAPLTLRAMAELGPRDLQDSASKGLSQSIDLVIVNSHETHPEMSLETELLSTPWMIWRKRLARMKRRKESSPRIKGRESSHAKIA